MKQFEDYFSELQADMVSISLEYSKKLVDKIYIYCSCEYESCFPNVFFENNGQFARKHKINEILPEKKVDVSDERQSKLLEILLDDLTEMQKVCKKFEKDMPTEIKLVYDVKQNSLKADYKYDVIYSHDEELLPDYIFDAWFADVSSAQK